jgi:hypothetical protein
LTHDTFTENGKWREFRRTHQSDFVFYHMDEFEQRYPGNTINFPAVFKLVDKSPTVVLNHTALNAMGTTDELIEHVKAIL